MTSCLCNEPLSPGAASQPAKKKVWILSLFVLAMACELIVPTKCHWWYGPNGEEPSIAEHLYRWHGFLSPFDSSPTAPPTSWSPPVYPVILSVFYHLFGVEGTRLRVALAIFQAGLFGVVTVGLFCLGDLLWSRAAGVIAALIHAFVPAFLVGAADFWDAYAALAIFVWLLFAAASLPRRATTSWHAAGLGLGLGLLSLTNAAYVLAYPLLVWMAAAGRSLRGRCAFAAVALAFFLLALTPWTLRNVHQFGRLFYVRDGPALELSISNTNDPPATGWFEWEVRKLHPSHNRYERQQLLKLGEIVYFNRCMHEFKNFYRADPRAFWVRTLGRAIMSFCGEPQRDLQRRRPRPGELTYAASGILKNPLNVSLSILGLIGGLAALLLRRRGAWILGCGILAVMPYWAAMVYARYLLPLRVTLALLAAFVIWEIARFLRRVFKSA